MRRSAGKPAALALALLASPAVALEQVHSVQEVFQADGLDHVALTKRALICIPKFATSGLITADTIISKDVGAGYVQARNAWQTTEFATLNFRSTITFEAKDGRFRITQDGFEVATGRSPFSAMIYPGPNTVTHMQQQSIDIAACIKAGPVGDF